MREKDIPGTSPDFWKIRTPEDAKLYLDMLAAEIKDLGSGQEVLVSLNSISAQLFNGALLPNEAAADAHKLYQGFINRARK